MSQKEPIFPVYRHELENNMFITEKEGGGVEVAAFSAELIRNSYSPKERLDATDKQIKHLTITRNIIEKYESINMLGLDDGNDYAFIKVNNQLLSLDCRKTYELTVQLSDLIYVDDAVDAAMIECTLSSSDFGDRTLLQISTHDYANQTPVLYLAGIASPSYATIFTTNFDVYHKVYVNDTFIADLFNTYLSIYRTGSLEIIGETPAKVKAGDVITLKPQLQLLFNHSRVQTPNGERYSVRFIEGEVPPISYTVTEEDVPPTSE